MLRREQIRPSEFNPRSHYDPAALTELAASIKSKGIVQPILVRPVGNLQDPDPLKRQYEVVCGHRRYKAAEEAGLETLPCTIRELSDDDALELQIIENLQRTDVHPMDEAYGFKQLNDRGIIADEIAARVGKSHGYVVQRMQLAALIKPLAKAFYENRMNVTTAFKVARFSDESQKVFWDEVKDSDDIGINNWHLRQMMGNLQSAPFDTKDPNLVKKAGACEGCPFNSASQQLLFESSEQGKCTKVTCYKEKTDVHFSKALEQGKAEKVVFLYSQSHEDSPVVKKLAKDGFEIGRRYEKWQEIEAPDEPWTIEEFVENNADLDYDDDAAIEKAAKTKKWQKEYNDYLADYHKEVKEHQEKVNSGKFRKALWVTGDDRGKWTIVEPYRSGHSLSSSKPKQSGKEFQEAVKSGEVTTANYKMEIERLNETEKKKAKEDGTNLNQEILNRVKSSTLYTNYTGKLVIDEVMLLIIMLSSHPDVKKDVVEELFGIKQSWNFTDTNAINAIEKALEKEKLDLFEFRNKVIRTCLTHYIPTHSGAKESDKVRLFQRMILQFDPAIQTEVVDVFNEKVAARKAKVKEKTDALAKKMKALAKPKDSGAKAAPKKQAGGSGPEPVKKAGLKALLGPEAGTTEPGFTPVKKSAVKSKKKV